VAPHHGENFTSVITPDGRTVYVGGSFGPSFNRGFVVPVSTATGAVGKAIVLRGHPYRMAVTPDGKTLYVVCAGFPGPQEVVPVNTATNTAGKAINTGMQPAAIAISGRQASPFEQAVQDGGIGARHVH
jgi:DNA-binding beta-propeller fold protein YncE